MRPVPIPKDMLPDPDAIAYRVAIIGPPPNQSILDDDSALPVEAYITEEGYHIRVALEDGEIEQLRSRPYVWMIFRSAQVPVFAVTTESWMLGEDMGGEG